jgi:hypothetical protein
MAEAKDRADWRRASASMALFATANAGKSRRKFSPADFDPYEIAKKNEKRQSKSGAGLVAQFIAAGGLSMPDVPARRCTVDVEQEGCSNG